LTTKGVVAVVVDASTFQFYGGGIFTGAGCSNSPNSGNHAVTLVGYNSTYFILRNSWSTEWGEQGYMRIASKLSFLIILYFSNNKIKLYCFQLNK
jgi:cathepsin F/cysteine peptidase B